jgi:DNA-binding response OmpR family regulator
VDENRGHTPRNARVVVVEDDDALEDLIMAWLAHHGLQTVPIRGSALPAAQRARPASGRRKSKGLTIDHVVDLPADLAGIGTRQRDLRSPTVVIVASDQLDDADRPELTTPVDVLRAGETSALGEWIDTFRLKSRNARRGHIRLGPLDIDAARQSAQIEGLDIRLTPTEFRLLTYLAENANRVVGHAELLRSVWSPGYEDDLHLLQQTVGSLRARIAQVTGEHLIESVYGSGYRMARSVEPPEDAVYELAAEPSRPPAVLKRR